MELTEQFIEIGPFIIIVVLIRFVDQCDEPD